MMSYRGGSIRVYKDVFNVDVIQSHPGFPWHVSCRTQLMDSLSFLLLRSVNHNNNKEHSMMS